MKSIGKYRRNLSIRLRMALGLSFIGLNLHAQEFSIKKIELLTDGVALHYDLLDTTRNRTYTVYVYSSKDNFIAPLEQLKGDAGLQVRPGENRKITWNPRAEFGPEFSGDIQLEIRGHVYNPFLRLEKFKDVQSRKRGFLVKWSGSSQNLLNFQLLQGDGILVHHFPNIPNTGEAKIIIPTSVKPGKDYYFHIADSKNRDKIVESQRFQIKRKYPLVAKVVVAIAAGYAIYYLTSDRVHEPPGTP